MNHFLFFIPKACFICFSSEDSSFIRFRSEESRFDKIDGKLSDPVAGVDGDADDGGPEGQVGHPFRQTCLGNRHQFVHLLRINLKR